MAVRQAELKKALKQLGNRNYTTTIDKIEITTSDGRVHDFSAAPGITILCGGNGAGKSSTLGALWRSLSSSDTGPTSLAEDPEWMKNVRISGSHRSNAWQTSYSSATASFSGHCPADVHYLDAATATGEIIQRVRNDDNPGDLIEGLDFAEFNHDLVEILSLLLRRKYDEIVAYEITSFSEEDEPFPFFSVSTLNQQYDLPRMGRGELSAAYLVWKLAQIESGSIVLVEEPESHLASHSQRHLLDVLVYFAVKRDLTLIVSSHSPDLFLPLPSRHIVLVSSLPIAALRTDLTTEEVADHLGLGNLGRKALILVEDFAAACFLRSVIDILDRPLLEHIAICYAENGESGVQKIISEIKRTPHGKEFNIIGILDGDMRNIPVKSGIHKEFLPGDSAPERVMREALEKWRVRTEEKWVPPINGGTTSLELALEKSEGLDHHDWLYSVSRRFGGVDHFIPIATILILEDPEIHDQAVSLTSSLRSAIIG